MHNYTSILYWEYYTLFILSSAELTQISKEEDLHSLVVDVVDSKEEGATLEGVVGPLKGPILPMNLPCVKGELY